MPASRNALKDAANRIQSKYPEFRNVSPKATVRSDGRTLLVFEKKTKTEDGVPITLRLRAVVSEDGKIESVSQAR